jgi:xylulokinase
MIIAHDLGTTGNKASLHHPDGRLQDAVTVNYPAHFAAGGIAEQDPEDWWNAVVSATRSLMEKSATPPASISGIVISGQMMGAVLLDVDNRPVRPAIIWADTRASAQYAQLSAALGEENAYTILGHRLNPTYSIEKIMWVRDNEPDVWARVRRVCVAKDYVALRISGRLATDRSDASGTNAYDQKTGQWSEEVLQAANLSRDLFPEILESIDVLGGVTDEAATVLGLNATTPIVMGGGDGPLAAVGAGVVSSEDGAYVSLGTSSWISFVTKAPVHDPSLRTFTFNNVVPGTFVPTATMQAGGASIQWFSEVINQDANSRNTAALINEADSSVDTEHLFFLPYLLGERSPLWEPSARGTFVGLGRHHTRTHMMRAVMEGVAYNLLTCMVAFRESGHPIDSITAVGGGAQSHTFLQVLADMWGVPVLRRSIVDEANSLGAAVTGAVGLGLADFSAARSLSEITGEFTPDASLHQSYQQRYALFADAIDALVPWFRKANP